jgi:hypothetical protein
VLESIAKKEYPPYFAVIAARLATNIQKEYALHQLDTLLQSEKGDMFWMYGCAGLYYSCRSSLPEPYKKKIRECWKKFTPYRGDTENHFLMYYAALLLMSQEWPDLTGREWFLGKSSEEIYEESKDYLTNWIDLSVKYGMMEFDSPRYMYYYITPMVLLAEYTRNDSLKTKFKMMLEYLLSDYADDYFYGNYCGAHSRVGFESPFDSRNSEVSSYGDFYFEENWDHLMPDVAFAAISSFTCPEMIRKIAREKSFPFESYETKRGRTVLRFAKEKNAVVVKKLFATSSYAIGSMQGGLVSPIQQQSWNLTIFDQKLDNVILGLHPFVSSDELGMFFPEEPKWQLQRIENVKKGYSSEAKWIGGSPIEEIDQQQNSLKVLCKNTVNNLRYQHLDFHIPKWATFDTTAETGQTLFAIRASKTGVILHVPSNHIFKEEGESYRIRIPFVAGSASYSLECSPKEETAIALPSTPTDYLFYSPYIVSRRGSGVVTLKWKGEERSLDFMQNAILEKH